LDGGSPGSRGRLMLHARIPGPGGWSQEASRSLRGTRFALEHVTCQRPTTETQAVTPSPGSIFYMTAVISSASIPELQLQIDAVLAARCRRGLVAVFDFDGTLVHIARTPDAVHAVPATAARLETLAKRPDTTVGVVSG